MDYPIEDMKLTNDKRFFVTCSYDEVIKFHSTISFFGGNNHQYENTGIEEGDMIDNSSSGDDDDDSSSDDSENDVHEKKNDKIFNSNNNRIIIENNESNKSKTSNNNNNNNSNNNNNNNNNTNNKIIIKKKEEDLEEFEQFNLQSFAKAPKKVSKYKFYSGI